MVKGKIKFNSIESVRRFVSTVEKCKADVDVQYGSIYLDGKSLEGLLSVQIGFVLDCTIHEKMENIQNTISELSEFVVESFVER